MMPGLKRSSAALDEDGEAVLEVEEACPNLQSGQV